MDLSQIDPVWIYVAIAAVAGYLFANSQKPPGARATNTGSGLRLPDAMTEKILNKAINGNQAGGKDDVGYSMRTEVPLEITITPRKKDGN